MKSSSELIHKFKVGDELICNKAKGLTAIVEKLARKNDGTEIGYSLILFFDGVNLNGKKILSANEVESEFRLRTN
jgi:hypothetical protein